MKKQTSQINYRTLFLIVSIFAITLFSIISVSAMLETSKPINLDKDNKLDFDGKKIDYNILWDNTLKLNNMVIKK